MDKRLPVFENIWLADDDKDDGDLFTDVVKQILPLSTVTVIGRGDLLMEKLKGEERPDCLFLDINMPEMDGLECLLQIRAQRIFRNLPIIIFSSTTQPAHLSTSYEYGANLFYTKPSSFQELIAGLSSILKLNWKDPGTVFNTANHNSFHPFFGSQSGDPTTT